MNILSKTAITTMATLTVSLGAAFIASAPSQAAGLAMPTQLTQNAVQGESITNNVHHRRGPRFGIYIGGGHGGFGWGSGGHYDDDYYDRPSRYCRIKRRRGIDPRTGRRIWIKRKVCR